MHTSASDVDGHVDSSLSLMIFQGFALMTLRVTRERINHFECSHSLSDRSYSMPTMPLMQFACVYLTMFFPFSQHGYVGLSTSFPTSWFSFDVL